MAENFIKAVKRGPKINDQFPLLKLDNKERGKILLRIKKDWRNLIDKHFSEKGGISDGNLLYKWKPLSSRYIKFKARKGLLPGILEASTPTLAERYKKEISYDSKTFSITILFPELETNKHRENNPQFVNAGIHQIVPGVRIKRRIIQKDFIAIARQRTIEYFTKNQ